MMISVTLHPQCHAIAMAKASSLCLLFDEEGQTLEACASHPPDL